MNNNPKWLSELEGTVPEAAYGISINAYTLAFEAWRRGLSVSFENGYSKSRGRHFIRYVISNRQKSVKFTHNRSDQVSQKSVKNASNKHKTRKILDGKNVPVVRNEIVKTADLKEIKSKIDEFKYPVRISKLTSPAKNIATKTAGGPKEVAEYIGKELNDNKSQKFLIEESADSKHYYAYIVDGKVIGVYTKETPYITGDGTKSINELLIDSNNIRKKIPSITNLEISVDQKLKNVLKKQNYNVDSVPEPGKKVTIKSEAGSKDPVDVTDIFSDAMKNKLVKITDFLPGLIQCEVEFLYDENTEDYSIFAINGRPGIRNYLYPMQGEARPVPKAIIDYYFPETKGEYLSDTTPKYYFDYEVVNDDLRNNRLSKIVLPEHRYEPNLVSKSISFQSDYNISKLKKIMRDYFIRLKFDGEFNVMNNSRFELIIVGNYQDAYYFYDHLNTKKYLKNITMTDHDGGVNVGYKFNDLRTDISDTPPKPSGAAKAVKNKSSRQIQAYKKKVRQRDDRIKALEREIEDLKKSQSWKITAPVRKIKSKLRK